MKISGNRPGSISGTSGTNAYTSVQKATGATPAAPVQPAARVGDVSSVLGIPEAEFTPSGVVRIAKLQIAGAAYIKP